MGQHPAFPVFVQGLDSLGWVDGRNVLLEPRFAEQGKPEQFDQLAADLVRLDVDVIVALIRPEIFAALACHDSDTHRDGPRRRSRR